MYPACCTSNRLVIRLVLSWHLATAFVKMLWVRGTKVYNLLHVPRVTSHSHCREAGVLVMVVGYQFKSMELEAAEKHANDPFSRPLCGE